MGLRTPAALSLNAWINKRVKANPVEKKLTEKPDEGTSDGIHHLDIVRCASYRCGGTHSCTRVAPQDDLGRLTWVRGHLWMEVDQGYAKLIQVHLPCKLIRPEGENVEKTDSPSKKVCVRVLSGSLFHVLQLLYTTTLVLH
jgi:hypothetical protein